MFELSGIRGTLVRYADDFVILLRGGGIGVLKQVEGMLRKLGLKIHPGKTRVVDTAKGFDFLGMHFRLRPVRKKDSKLKIFCQVWPSDRSMNGIKQKIKRKIGRRYSLSLEEIISDLNPVIRGYRNYHTVMGSAPKRRRRLNYFVHERLRIFLKRKYSDQTRCYKRTHGNLFVRLGLNQFV